MRRLCVISFTAVVVVLACAGTVWAQAYCALRDPVREIHELFPGPVSIRSEVRTISDEVRAEVGARLPFGLLHSELGQHTVYAIYLDQDLQGYVHSRSEKTRWGLIEIAWALDPQLAILDFRFQRCRDPSRRVIESDVFRSKVLGAREAELRQMLTEDATDVTANGPAVPDKSRALVAAVIRSALRTIVVTDVVWTQPLAKVAPR